MERLQWSINWAPEENTQREIDLTTSIINKLITEIAIYGANPDKHKQITKSMAQAEQYCSISETINRLGAEMILNIEFK